MTTKSILELANWNEDQEFTLLLSLLRKDVNLWQDTTTAFQLQEMDWSRLLRLTEHHRVVPTVYLQLKTLNHPFIPAELLRNLQAQYHRNTLRMLHLQAEAERLTRLLTAHGIRVLMLKGPALAQQLYGDVSLRTSKDIDLLIAPDDMDEAEHWMKEAGYASKSGEVRVLGSWKWKDHHASFLQPQKRVEVELHWRLHPDGGREPSFDELWDCRQMGKAPAVRASQMAPATSADSRNVTTSCMYTLGSEHQFLYLSAHGARHGWFRLRWLVDIDRLAVRAVDWRALLPQMRRYGGLPAGGQAWALAAALLGTSTPEPMRPISATRQAHRLALSALAFMQASVPAPYPVANGAGTGRLVRPELLPNVALTESMNTAPSDGGISANGTSGEAVLYAVSSDAGISKDASSILGDPVNTVNTAVSSLAKPVGAATVASSPAIAGATTTAFTPQPVSRAYLLSLKEPRHRLWYLISRLFPSTRDSVICPLPRQLHFLYIPLRPFLWLKRRFSKH
ncbi:nucleotidyltransferase family protein [Paenibacillus polymyxa]|uniref:nucleotidyltransferase family protein n=1 Tax=Paenibacillus polymyxa TaxID=1406 RepID=UPI001C9DEF84|nr:nucleotidyltransferase family protein [Paenibacillus polymyxa]MBY7736787.1 nucleotidyltransferase family protein [Paenibacillus polymyxa]